MRPLVLLVLVVCCSLGFASADEPERKDGRVVVEFWHGMGNEQGRAVNEIADHFNRAQEKYYLRPNYQGNYNALGQKLIASLYAGRHPAVAQMYPGWTSRYYRFGYMDPIERFLEEDPAYREELKDFQPIVLEESTLVNPKTGKSELVTLPFNKSVYILYVNQTLMEELGWKQPPRTRAELLRLAEAMTLQPDPVSPPTRYGFASRPFIEDLTVQVFADNGMLLRESDGEVLFDSSEVLEAMTFHKRLVSGESGQKQVGYIEPGFLSNVFGSGRVGMYIASTASFPFNDSAVGTKFIWRAYAVPSAEEGVPGKTLMQGTNVGIFARLHPEVRAGAWEFMKFLSSPEINAYWAVQTGYMPTRLSTRQQSNFMQLMATNPSYANAVEAFDRAAFEPRVVYWESIRQMTSRRVEAILLGRETVEEGLAAAEREATAIVANSR
jgi:multiple sugar transport system substrate-binding protein